MNDEIMTLNLNELEPGLYDINNNLLKTWEELKNDGDITIENTNITKCDSTLAGKLIISSEITNIGGYCFGQCSNLIDIYLPDSIINIDGDAFNACVGLTEITLPKNLTIINRGLFINCNNLETINIQEGVKIIEYFALAGCTKLRNLNFPYSLTLINDLAVTDVEDLGSVKIPNSNCRISSNSFPGCKNTTFYFNGDASLFPWGAIDPYLVPYVDYKTVSELFKGICDNLRIKIDKTSLIQHSSIPYLINSIQSYSKNLIIPNDYFKNDIISNNDLSNLKNYIKSNPSSLIILDYLFDNKKLDTDFYNIDLSLEDEKYKVLSLNNLFSNSSFNNDYLQTLEPLINSENALYAKNIFKNSNFKNIDLITLPLNKLMYIDHGFENCNISGQLKNLRIDMGNLIDSNCMFYNASVPEIDFQDINIDNCLDTTLMVSSENISKIILGNNFKITNKTKKCDSMFYNFNGEIDGNFDNFEFGDVDLSFFFAKNTNNSTDHAYSLNIFKNMNVSRVKNFSNFFRNRRFIDFNNNTLDWNLSNCEDLSYCFYNCYHPLNYPSSNPFRNCILPNLKTMSNIFYNNKTLYWFTFNNEFEYNNYVNLDYCCRVCTTLDTVKLNNIKVSSLIYSFGGCSNLNNIDFEEWDLSNCQNFSGCFSSSGLNSSSLKLPNFKVNNDSNFRYFCDLSNFGKIDLSGMDFSDYNPSSLMSNNYLRFMGQISKNRKIILPDFYSKNCFDFTDWISVNNNTSKVDLEMGGNLKTFGIIREGDNENDENTVTLNLTGIWKVYNSIHLDSYINFANSLGESQDNLWSKVIKIHTNLYAGLSSSQKELITNKGYILSYGIS